jgi:hypothetical protein
MLMILSSAVVRVKGHSAFRSLLPHVVCDGFPAFLRKITNYRLTQNLFGARILMEIGTVKRLRHALRPLDCSNGQTSDARGCAVFPQEPRRKE